MLPCYADAYCHYAPAAAALIAICDDAAADITMLLLPTCACSLHRFALRAMPDDYAMAIIFTPDDAMLDAAMSVFAMLLMLSLMVADYADAVMPQIAEALIFLIFAI